MKRPSFQFYPADWQGNAKLRRASHAERGIWVSCLCLMHDSDEAYGVLHWPLAELANAVGCKTSDLEGLRKKGILKGADEFEICVPHIFTPRHAGKDGDPVTLIEGQPGPIWYSSRMVRDEYIRSNAGAKTRFAKGNDTKPTARSQPSHGDGGEPTQRHGAPPSQREGYGASSSSSSSSSKDKSATPPAKDEVKPETQVCI